MNDWEHSILRCHEERLVAIKWGGGLRHVMGIRAHPHTRSLRPTGEHAHTRVHAQTCAPTSHTHSPPRAHRSTPCRERPHTSQRSHAHTPVLPWLTRTAPGPCTPASRARLPPALLRHPPTPDPPLHASAVCCWSSRLLRVSPAPAGLGSFRKCQALLPAAPRAPAGVPTN